MEPRVSLRAGVSPCRWVLAGIILFASSMLSPAGADEIRFRNRDGVQAGTVLEEDGRSVTVRFPREAIDSITRVAGSPVNDPKRGPAPLEERVRELERKVDSLPATGRAIPGQEEAGAVEGIILWKGRPMAQGRVMIIPSGVARASGGKKGDLYETETDAGGRYRFERVRPGAYLLYWMPDGETGWVRRLRDLPDLDVVPGGVAVLNIPEKRK